MAETTPSTGNRTLPIRRPNKETRDREYLTPSEVADMIEAARKRGRGGNGARDAAAIGLAFRHGLRAQELVTLKWSQIEWKRGAERVHIRRAKGGSDGVHPLFADDLRALRALQPATSAYIFTTEGGSPVTTAWFLRMVQRTGEAAGIAFPIHPHMLRHGAGYKLANEGRTTRELAEYLGHRNLNNTARYSQLAAGRFDNWFE